MRVRRGLAWAVLGPLLVLACPARARADEGSAALWRDPAVLEKHLDAACSAVEAVCGDQFWRRPTVRISTQEELRSILRGQYGTPSGMLETLPDETRRFIAYYEPNEAVVHILPEALVAIADFFRAPALLGEDMMRVILVHEATHAFDFDRFPVRWALACCADSDERLATEAVLEGHAQLVAEEVSRAWGIESAFQRLTRLYTGDLLEGSDGLAIGLDQEAAFTYIEGHAFMRTIRAERGSQGVDAVLRDPPFETRVIDRPILWLQPELRGQEPDLQALLDVFMPLIPAPDWEVSKWRVLGPAIPLLEDDGSGGGPVESYVDNHGLYAGSPGGNRYLNLFIAFCRSERDAERFVAALREVDEARDDDPEWRKAERREGAGTDGRLEGFTSRRRASSGVRASDLTLQVVHQGRHVIELSTYGLEGVDRRAQDRTLDLAARILRSTPPSAAAVALRGHVKSFLTARAIGRVERARELMRGLLPSEADLRRVVRPAWAQAFEDRYSGLRIALRTTPIQNATLYSAFQEAAPDSLVRAWAATTEELAAGTGAASKYPPEMQAFCRDVAAPGLTWMVLTLRTPEGEALRYACFVRFGDRFLWVKDPWLVDLQQAGAANR